MTHQASNNGMASGDLRKKQQQVLMLYQGLLQNWNDRNAEEFASLFTEDGLMIGFDGSEANGRKDIYEHLSGVFEHHQTGRYISIVREIKFLDNDIALLRAVSGIIPQGSQDINPAANAIQTLLAHRTDDSFCIALYQNTPAAFHGRPEMAEALTRELRNVIALS